jgi:hypothetical protein
VQLFSFRSTLFRIKESTYSVYSLLSTENRKVLLEADSFEFTHILFGGKESVSLIVVS